MGGPKQFWRGGLDCHPRMLATIARYQSLLRDNQKATVSDNQPMHLDCPKPAPLIVALRSGLSTLTIAKCALFDLLGLCDRMRPFVINGPPASSSLVHPIVHPNPLFAAAVSSTQDDR